MKIYQKHLRWAIPGTLAIATAFALLSWTGGPGQTPTAGHDDRDTVPAKQRTKVTREPGDKDLDWELRQLDVAQESLKNVDWERIQETVNNALKNVDAEKIQKIVEKSLEAVDMEKIQQQVEESLKKIDFDKIQEQVNESLKHELSDEDKKEIKKAIKEAQKEIKEELKKENWKKEIEDARQESRKEIKEELEKAKDEVAKAKKEMDKERLNFKDEMKKAQVEIDKAKEELKGYQEMIYAMEAEGLLSTKEDYTIEWKKGELLINDKVQPAETATKYKKYFRKDMKLKKKDGKFDMDGHHHQVVI
jgi:hypothetical protein